MISDDSNHLAGLVFRKGAPARHPPTGALSCGASFRSDLIIASKFFHPDAGGHPVEYTRLWLIASCSPLRGAVDTWLKGGKHNSYPLISTHSTCSLIPHHVLGLKAAIEGVVPLCTNGVRCTKPIAAQLEQDHHHSERERDTKSFHV